MLAYTQLASGEAGGPAATRALGALTQAVEHVTPFGIRQSLFLVCLVATHLGGARTRPAGGWTSAADLRAIPARFEIARTRAEREALA